MSLGKCQNCVWWGPNRVARSQLLALPRPVVLGTCHHERLGGQLCHQGPAGAADQVVCDEGGPLLSGAEFGCVHFEARH